MTILAEWERKLSPFFNQNIRIIGEIPLSEADLEEILDSARDEIKAKGLSQTTDRLEKYYPHTFLTMLAHYAAHNDQQGYWNTLGERLETEHIFNYKWHRKFVNACRDYGLFTFTRRDMNNYYVATVRFHGGIPTYSLPDFFDKMVIPAVTRAEYREVPPKELLPHLIDTVRFVDKPVLDFLENSAEMGMTWFEQCCELARHAKQNYGEVLPKEAVPDLPLYIFQFFENYNEGLEGTRYHWRRPILQIAPYSEDTAVILNLPQQAIPLDLYTKGFTWKISWPGIDEPIQIPCKIKRLGHDNLTEEEFYPLSPQSTSVTVSIVSRGEREGKESNIQEYRRWTLSLMPPETLPPIIAFRQDCRHISNPQNLPARPLYLLLPKKSNIVLDGEGYLMEALPELVGDWEEWKLEAWDLTDALYIALTVFDPSGGKIIPIAREMAQPGLEGGHLFDYQENPDQPLYTHGVPKARMPVRRGVNKSQALAGWMIQVNSLWEAKPKISKHISLLNYLNFVELSGEWAYFPLEELLGKDAAGIYDVKILGPRGLQSEHRLRLWPKLLVRGLSLDFPEPEEADQDIQFSIRLQENAELRNQSGAEKVEIINVDDTYLINASPEVWRVRLNLLTKAEKETLVRIPVSIPLPRLRWALAEEKIPGELPFGQKLLNLSSTRFDQYESSALHIRMCGLEDINEKLKCQLVEVSDGFQLLQEAKIYPTGFVRDWLRVSLRDFTTTIQETNALLQFQLVYKKDWQSDEVRYPLLTITPQLIVENVQLESIDDTIWRLSWKADKLLKNRRVMIKSLWKPWESPIELRIPNKNQCKFLFKEERLTPSYDEVYFYVMNDWVPTLTVPPEGIEPHLVKLCSADQRLTELQNPADGHDAEFRASIEKACIYDSLGDLNKRDEAVSEATKHLRYLQNLKTLVGSINWLQTKNITPSFKSFFIKNLFHPQIVETMLSKYNSEDPALQKYLRMTADVNSMHLVSAKRLLESSDDPVVMSACLNEMIKRKDKEYVTRITSLVKDGRLSKDDAVTYLLKIEDDHLWVLGEFERILWSPFIEMVIAGYLDAIYDDIDDKSLDVVKGAMYRAASCEKSEARIHEYLMGLINIGWQEADVYELLLDRHLAGMINDEYFLDLISIYPEKSLMVLEETTETFPEYQTFIEYIEEKYPEARGIFRPGLDLGTPFGIAKIEKIIDLEGNELDEVLINQGGFILEMVEGKGLSKIRAQIDFENMEITFPGNDHAWRCNVCKSFVHPNQHRIHQHFQDKHPYESMAFGKVCCPIFFIIDDIKYFDQGDR